MCAAGAIVDNDCQKLYGNYITNLQSCHSEWGGQQMILHSNRHLKTPKTSQFQKSLVEDSRFPQARNGRFDMRSSLDCESCTAGFPTGASSVDAERRTQKSPAFPRESTKKNLCNAFS